MDTDETQIKKRKAGKRESGNSPTERGMTADFCNALRQLQMDTDFSPSPRCESASNGERAGVRCRASGDIAADETV
jgi:hypothetical protein